MTENAMEQFILGLPKAELHLHIEGSFEPELMFSIAERNHCTIKYKTVEEVRSAYHFNNLQEFLDIYYEGAGVLQKEQDFYDLGMAYFTKVAAQGVVHAEIFFDPQTHTSRGIPFATVINGIHSAQLDAEKEYGISSRLIMCFLRHLDAAAAMETLEAALPHLSLITGVGLDSSELGHPPSKFKEVFERARDLGLRTVAHAGEEGPSSYIWEAIELLQVSRIDHGNRSLEDPALLTHLEALRMPLTICPLSNLKLCVVKDMSLHPLRDLMARGLMVTVNSDDPAYFGGYMHENFCAVQKALQLSKQEIVQLAENSFHASFISDNERARLLGLLQDYVNTFAENQ